ncbi:arginine N-succinyltransferase [Candidatus Thiothrix sp. Deng01]|uniref:Arginine N-succinyltransferase n=1 Tax=Candidatus Thiothrix phosphatis TaxID=3112415 RepID=A0ABU6CU51_9GAMM|nr:arginine N-succinyltransferase [Candidatus Thiothrix sp. Deng01]MEB4590294.1 arginine N-succinyltransferase [Candidatus Thiothrix sp. Deng01]
MDTNSEHKIGCLHVAGLILLTVFLSVSVTLWVAQYFLFPKPFTPVKLNQQEETTLEHKLQQIGLPDLIGSNPQQPEDLTPEPYNEANAKREISLSEKELNALLAKNTELGEKAVIDLSENLASAKILLPLDPDFPFIGGKTLKVNTGLELAYANGRPVVKLKGVSVWGVPLPNAWLGNLKNVDMVNEFGGNEGFWKSFADGVEDIHVEEGHLLIKLKE